MIRRWLKRFAMTVGFLLLVSTTGLLLQRHFTRSAGEAAYAQAAAGLDATDPGWRLDDIVAAREAGLPPPEKNGATRVKSAHAALPKSWEKWTADTLPTIVEPELPHTLDAETLAAARAMLAEAATAVKLARELTAYPSGGHPYVVEQNPLNTRLQDVQNTRAVAGLLAVDATVAAHDKNWPQVKIALLAGLNAGRCVGDRELFLITALVRFALAQIAVKNAERCLAWGLAADTIADLQAEFLKESRVDLVTSALRGERAMFDTLMQRIDDGTLDRNEVTGQRDPTLETRLGWWYFRSYLPADRVAFVEFMTAAIAATRTPPPEIQAALAAVPVPPATFAHVLSRMLLPAVDKVLVS